MIRTTHVVTGAIRKNLNQTLVLNRIVKVIGLLAKISDIMTLITMLS